MKTRAKLAPRLCAWESSETQGGIIELMNPIPRPATTRATMNMFEFCEAAIDAPPVAKQRSKSNARFAAIFVCYPATEEAAEHGPKIVYCYKATVCGEEMSANIFLRE